ncbi:hypothetical protein [Porphyromonas endodontalis]|uniref:hypothetical protein n=1 Tax=Porphyromonas endodontalis TaxID=28124 RepID=UPI0028EECDAC|nr:hypothetical protein [Porphyromonas endodontalis]
MTKFSQLKFVSLSVMLLLLLAGCNANTPLLEGSNRDQGRPEGVLEIVVTVLDSQNKPLEGMMLELVDMPLEQEVNASAKTNVRGVAKLSKDVYISDFMQPCHVRVRDAEASGRDYTYRPWYGTILLSKKDFVRKKARKELVVHLERIGVSPSSLSLGTDA